jgi:hypothetical protein
MSGALGALQQIILMLGRRTCVKGVKFELPRGVPVPRNCKAAGVPTAGKNLKIGLFTRVSRSLIALIASMWRNS